MLSPMSNGVGINVDQRMNVDPALLHPHCPQFLPCPPCLQCSQSISSNVCSSSNVPSVPSALSALSAPSIPSVLTAGNNFRAISTSWRSLSTRPLSPGKEDICGLKAESQQPTAIRMCPVPCRADQRCCNKAEVLIKTYSAAMYLSESSWSRGSDSLAQQLAQQLVWAGRAGGQSIAPHCGDQLTHQLQLWQHICMRSL